MNRLKELRKEKGVRQFTLGIAIGVSERTISRWENDETQIKPDKAQMLADYFGVNVGYLLGYESKGVSLLSRIEVKTMSDFLIQTGKSDEYRQGVKDLEELIVTRLEEKFSVFYSSVFSEELEKMKIEDKRHNILDEYMFLIDGKWIFVSPYEYHCFEIGDTAPSYVVERRSK